MTHTLVIFNPVSGRGRAAKEWPQVQAELDARGVQFDVATTRESLHAVRLAWDAPNQGYDRIVAAGGDGLVHEIVNGLLRASDEGETIALGIIPLGNGNDFNKMMPPVCRVGQMHNDWHEAVRKIAAGETQLFDAGRIVGDKPAPGHPHPHYFQNGMDVGFGALVAKYARDVPGFLSGTSMYLASVFKTLLAYQVPRLCIHLDNGQVIDQRSTMTAVANGRCFGGGFWIAPQAQVDDGHFDLLIAEGLGRVGILGLVPRVMNGTHMTHPAVRMTQASRVVIDSPDPLVVEADGEIPFLEAQHLEVEILPRRLRVVV